MRSIHEAWQFQQQNIMIHMLEQLPIRMPTISNYPCWRWWNENTHTSPMLATLAILVPHVLWNKRIPFRTWTAEIKMAHWPMKMRRMTLRVGEARTYKCLLCFSHWIVWRSSVFPGLLFQHLRWGPLLQTDWLQPELFFHCYQLSQILPIRFSVQDPWWINATGLDIKNTFKKKLTQSIMIHQILQIHSPSFIGHSLTSKLRDWPKMGSLPACSITPHWSSQATRKCWAPTAWCNARFYLLPQLRGGNRLGACFRCSAPLRSPAAASQSSSWNHIHLQDPASAQTRILTNELTHLVESTVKNKRGFLSPERIRPDQRMCVSK